MFPGGRDEAYRKWLLDASCCEDDKMAIQYVFECIDDYIEKGEESEYQAHGAVSVVLTAEEQMIIDDIITAVTARKAV